MSDRFESEFALQDALGFGLEREGNVVLREFPLLGKVADFFVVGAHACIAIECKLKGTGEAVRQARVYQQAADFVYIAMPARRGPRGWDAQLATLGIGLLEVDGDGAIAVLIEATLGSPHPAFRSRALAQVDYRREASEHHGGTRCAT